MSRSAAKRRPTMRAIHAIRLENLKRLIEELYDGNGAAAAKAINRSTTFLWQLVNEKRMIGEETARHIEQSLGRKHLSLDNDRGGVLKQSVELTVVQDDGARQTFRLTPVVEFTLGLNKKIRGRYRPCPIPCSGGTVATRVPTDSLSPVLTKGDWVYIEQEIDKSQIKDGSVYLIEVRGVKVPLFRIAQRREDGEWRFIVLKGDEPAIDSERVTSVKPAIQMGRDLP